MKNYLYILLATAFIMSSSQVSAQPLIGISSGLSKTTMKLNDTYTIAVSKAGGVPVILPRVRTEDEAEELVKKMDGIIFSGGEDVHPTYYGESVLYDNVKCNFQRDTSDMLILKASLRQKKPILGICRGMQLVNVGTGGTLYQDLPSQVPSDIRHKQEEDATIPTHAISISKGSLLYKIMESDSVKVNSKHHQAVKTTGPGMKITAKADDGVIEAIEGKNIVCVQFHPEAMIKAGNDKFLPIFENLISRAKRKR